MVTQGKHPYSYKYKVCRTFADDYDRETVAYARHSCNSISPETSMFSLALNAWLSPAIICLRAMAKH